MNAEERAQIRIEEHLQDRGILEPTAAKGMLVFGCFSALAGYIGGCESTAQLINSVPPDLMAQEIRKEAMYVLDNLDSFKGFGNDIINASFVGVIGAGVGMAVGKLLDLIGKARSRVAIPGIDEDADGREE